MSWRLRRSSSSDAFIGSAAWCAHQPVDPVSLSTLRYANSDRYSTDLNNYTRLFSGIRRRTCTSVVQTCQMPAAGRRAAHHRTKNYFQARSRSAVFSNHPRFGPERIITPNDSYRFDISGVFPVGIPYSHIPYLSKRLTFLFGTRWLKNVCHPTQGTMIKCAQPNSPYPKALDVNDAIVKRTNTREGAKEGRTVGE